jgi:mevalonate kinase
VRLGLRAGKFEAAMAQNSAHKGFGKLILFGEHFVVYKVPALVAAVSDFTDCTVEIREGSGLETVDNRPAVPGYKVEKKDEQDEATKLVVF